MDEYTYLVIGGGLAGGRACDGIRAVDGEGSIALLTAEPHRPYQRPPLSKGYLGGRVGLDEVYLKDAAAYREAGVTILEGEQVTELDRTAHLVRTAAGRELRYAKLLLATGGRAWRLPIAGADLPGVYTLRTIEDSNAIREAARPGTHGVVLGGSYIGSEVSATLSQAGARVTMVFPESHPLERFSSPAFSALLEGRFQAHGVTVLAGNEPERLEGNGRVQRVVLKGGRAIDVAWVVMGVGIRLNTALAASAGLSMNDEGAVVVDRYLRTSDPDIYAAGDIALWPERTSGQTKRVEHWDVARSQGLRAGRNMAGEGKPYLTLPYFFSDIYDVSVEVWGGLSAPDELLTRGSVDDLRFAQFYFKDGVLIGVLTAGRSKDERQAYQALIKARVALDQVREALLDERADLGALAR